MKVTLAELTLPNEVKLPVLRKPIEGRVKDYAGYLADWRKDGQGWQFPPLTVAAIPKPEPAKKGTPPHVRALGKAYQAGKRYVVADGGNRLTAATAVKWRDGILVEVLKQPATDTTALWIAGLTENLKAGTPLTPEVRAAGIHHMRADLKMTQVNIARKLHLSEASVSRILRDQQTGAGAKTAKKTAKKKTAKTPDLSVATPGDAVLSLVTLGRVLHQTRVKIIEHLAAHQSRTLAGHFQTLATLMTAFAEAVTPTTDPAPDPVA